MESTTPQTPQPEPENAKPTNRVGWIVLIGFGLFLALGCCLGPVTHVPRSNQSWHVQIAHAVGLAMFSYANDNNGLYPDGTSSTEVFQKLMDGGYVTDPSIFFVAMDGKTKATFEQKILKPENVCWDVTGGLASGDSGSVPLLFLTGYRFTYAPGGGFTPLKPFPRYENLTSDSGLAVFFMNNSASWLIDFNEGAANKTAHFLPPDFNPQGKIYRQLTPDGVLK